MSAIDDLYEPFTAQNGQRINVSGLKITLYMIHENDTPELIELDLAKRSASGDFVGSLWYAVDVMGQAPAGEIIADIQRILDENMNRPESPLPPVAHRAQLRVPVKGLNFLSQTNVLHKYGVNPILHVAGENFLWTSTFFTREGTVERMVGERPWTRGIHQINPKLIELATT